MFRGETGDTREDGRCRAISPIVGGVLMIAIVLAAVAVAGTLVLSLGSDTVERSAIHTQAHYGVETTMNNEHLLIQPNAVNKRDTDLMISINGVEVKRWNGTETVEIDCLYPNDKLTIVSTTEDGSSMALVEETYFEEATSCEHYDSFPAKFRHAVVDGKSFVINDRYAFGLSIVPNGDSVAHDSTGDEDLNLGNISLANEWHHIELVTDSSVEGFEPPVFVVVLVDNVHWEEAPDPSEHSEVDSGDYYNWTDSPPNIETGETAFTINGNQVVPQAIDATEPTNDVYMVFNPGCGQSKLRFLEQQGGYNSQIYLEDRLIVDDTDDTSYEDTVFTAPGVDCPGNIEWE
jgi:FlaG/FlaF family flagellin (archaellin)